MKSLDRIAIVGGGTAGFVTALILKTRFPNSQIDIIKSKKIGIIGVGEGSTEHWENFMNYVGINPYDLITQTDATFKVGIKFTDWGVPDYVHSLHGGYTNKIHNYYPYIYGYLASEKSPSTRLSNKQFWEGNINKWYLENNVTPVAQYHFNTFKLNDYLTKFSLSKGISIIDDEIIKVNHSADGNISTIEGEEQIYKYDFYIDSTGFKKLLISSLGAKWCSYKDYLKVNSAIVFPTEHKDKDFIPMWTTSKAMNAGWMFTIPVFDRNGNGYIFDDTCISADDAKKEVEALLGHDINIGKHIKFDPGALDTPWIKNCCAIGLSSSFIEPLEASSIGSSIQQAYMLVQSIVNYSDSDIDRYNKSFKSVIENIRDFVALHYVCKRSDTEFWKKVSKIDIPETLKLKLRVWKHRFPNDLDFDHDSNFTLFKPYHFLMVLYGLELFDLDDIANEFNSLGDFVKTTSARVTSEIEFPGTANDFLTHKNYLLSLRG